MKVWIDITNLPQAPFFASLTPFLEDAGAQVTITTQGAAAIPELLKGRGLAVHRHRPAKKVGLRYAASFLTHLQSAPAFDVALSFENISPLVVARARRKRAVVFLDNDLKLRAKGFVQRGENALKRRYPEIYVPTIAFAAFQAVLPARKIKTFDGLKEDVSLASPVKRDLAPGDVPFREYVIVRPESPESAYVDKHDTFASDLLKELVGANLNVVYLPRTPAQKALAPDSPYIYIPTRVLDGYALIKNSNGVLTGSGTMSREAAVLGVPAVSFFPNRELLAVDKFLVKKGAVRHTRDAHNAVSHVLHGLKQVYRPPDGPQLCRALARLVLEPYDGMQNISDVAK